MKTIEIKIARISNVLTLVGATREAKTSSASTKPKTRSKITPSSGANQKVCM